MRRDAGEALERPQVVKGTESGVACEASDREVLVVFGFDRRTVCVTRARAAGVMGVRSGSTSPSTCTARAARRMPSSCHATGVGSASAAQASAITRDSVRTGGNRSDRNGRLVRRAPVSAVIASKYSG